VIDPSLLGGPEPLSSDTSLEAETRQLEAWRRMSSIEIARTIRAAWSAGRRMEWMGLRERFPDADDDELRVRLALRTLGPDLAGRIHPEAARYSDG
jgi:hypothetical protein